jgi:hypothetical protein
VRDRLCEITIRERLANGTEITQRWSTEIGSAVSRCIHDHVRYRRRNTQVAVIRAIAGDISASGIPAELKKPIRNLIAASLAAHRAVEKHEAASTDNDDWTLRWFDESEGEQD